jgi:uncharacterized protein YndB with AHSA1/START domain
MTSGTVLSTPADREVVAVRVFDAPRERVFALYTDPELIPSWWGPRDQGVSVERMDVVAGGSWRFLATDSSGSELAFFGTYREVTAPGRIVSTFGWEGMAGHTLVETVTFEDLGGSTRLTVTASFDTTEDRDGMLAAGMERGLTQSHDRLAELLAAEST